MGNARLDESHAGIKIARRTINNLRYEDTTLMAESEEEIKSLLMKVKEESGKAGLKLNIRSWPPCPLKASLSITNSWSSFRLRSIESVMPSRRPGMLWFMESQRVRHDSETELNWTEDRGSWSYHFMANRWENFETVSDFIFFGSKSMLMVIAAIKLKDSHSLKE